MSNDSPSRGPRTAAPAPMGSTVAIVVTAVGYAAHPTSLAWENTLISPDYPGALREVVETATGAPCACSAPLSSMKTSDPSEVPATMPFPSGAGQRCMTPPFRLSSPLPP